MDMLLHEGRAATTPMVGDTVADHYWQGQVDAATEAVALVDTGQRILHMTVAFERVVQAGDGVRVVGRMPHARLTTVFPEEQARLNAAIARAVMRTAPVPAAMRCARPGGRAPLVVVVHPIPWATRLLRGDEGTAILTLIDPARRPAPAASLWCEAFELTPCETALATLLVGGHSVESAAAMRDCHPTTLRVHLRRIFAKTGTSRQADLVALLMRIACK